MVMVQDTKHLSEIEKISSYCDVLFILKVLFPASEQ